MHINAAQSQYNPQKWLLMNCKIICLTHKNSTANLGGSLCVLFYAVYAPNCKVQISIMSECVCVCVVCYTATLEVSVVANVSFNQVRIGDTVVLTCSLASDTNVTNPLYTWMYVDREETLSETSNMLILFEIMSDQFGTYRCGISSDGELASANITIMQGRSLIFWLLCAA